jgi:hypothetical protein
VSLKEFENKIAGLGLTDYKDSIFDFLSKLYCNEKSMPFSILKSGPRPQHVVEDQLLKTDPMILEVVDKLGLTKVSRSRYERYNDRSETLYEIYLTEEGEDIASEIVEKLINSSSYVLKEVLGRYPKTLLMILCRHMVGRSGWARYELPPHLDIINRSGKWFYGEGKLYRYEVEMILENARRGMGATFPNTLDELEAYFWRSVSWHPIFRQYCESLLKKLSELGLIGYKEVYKWECLYSLPPQLLSFINSYVGDNYNKPSREVLSVFMYMWLLTSAMKRLTRQECIDRLRLLDLTEMHFSEYIEQEGFYKNRLTSRYDMSAKYNEQPLIIIKPDELMRELSDRFGKIVSIVLMH